MNFDFIGLPTNVVADEAVGVSAAMLDRETGYLVRGGAESGA